MNVEIWADMACPWCGLGEHRFQEALRRFVHRDDVEVVHRSFQLDATVPVGQSMPVRAQFGDRQSIFGTDSLVDLATKMGLDPVAVRTALETRQYRADVEQDGLEARQLGGTGVPFFVIDRRYGVTGAQPADVLLEALQQAWHEGDAICGSDACFAATP